MRYFVFCLLIDVVCLFFVFYLRVSYLIFYMFWLYVVCTYVLFVFLLCFNFCFCLKESFHLHKSAYALWDVQIFSKEEITFCVRSELLVRWNLIVYLYLSDITVSRVSPVRFCKTSPRKRYLHGIKDIFLGLHFIQVILAGYNFFIFKTSIFYRATFSLGLFPVL